jgi:hypothetical protein
MGVVVLYGPAIYQAAAGGDLTEMRRVLQLAEEHLSEWGDIPTAVALLKTEIAKAELRA